MFSINQGIEILFQSLTEGKYSQHLIDFMSRLVHGFCSRLHKERFNDFKDSKPHWIPKYSEKLFLTDEQVEKICKIIQPALMDLAMSKR